ncbi:MULTISPECIES: alpha-amylase family glycosyl hydrolase [Xanthomonas]|uniref:alpha-amylase family glycosyl hydrolase n=1 Tax=Xanthomonas TaxID=338 RepID=UPI001ADA41EA|nr:alpha-amylase family glycosyl hydrolase [Xanthomonas phaseoli]MBO9769783.1 alpha-glucosidase [Xanthomonas phaseoli pv. dieffenbachiae]MBO9776875.1 alpha-glucosidase [Xanthomonas phaseoli pv. dieffenbachiae]MBO9778766.1 alpha-glucosidase [Xanthomonas phaseoli pv. dieffenbachiae]MBO9796654.1 alpha-glucosidase [Xanthomonas phaseoli pv. dieffenbachiae]MBO9799262.1 alpha-glucosidase [Xanthomonas phaseoli pv. dieffenbachiae]
MLQTPCWRGAVIYQIYPRSFLDSNGDGVGDLPGIIAKLDYIAGLGVDAIWISPFFKSPMADFGYDIADYRAVDPLFGTLDDFDRLLDKAHTLGLKVMIDQVLSHTSIEHAWFQESRQDRTNAKADWYVWADPREDGTPPNNWLSLFGGVAWQWEPRREQYYLHNFLVDQPDLNFHNIEVQQATLDNVRFWLDRGVDGFRLDAINFCFHDAQLRDNPAKPADRRVGRGFSADNPYAYQYHYFNNTQPENLTFLERLRALLDRYPNAVSLGEISSEDSLATTAEYTAKGRLHMGYSFELLVQDYSAAYIRETVSRLEATMLEGWPCWAISNHDVVRAVTRWGGEEASPAFARMVVALLCSLRGSVCLYQGEELGLSEADVAFEDLQDPYGITFWPTFKGRDGCRTPMPWTDAPSAGFTSGKPWLPLSEPHRLAAVSVQQDDAQSVLSAVRAFLAWRKGMPALREGAIMFYDTAEPVLMFRREHAGQVMLLAFNLSSDVAELALPEGAWEQIDVPGVARGVIEDGRVSLPGHAVVCATGEG